MENIYLRSNEYTAVISPEYGANCIALLHNLSGVNLLRTPGNTDDLKKEPYLYGIPILFPPNRIADGKFIFNNQEYRFPVNEPLRGVSLHGELCQENFYPQRLTENYACLCYRATKARPYSTFPHAFSVTIEYLLDDSGLTQKATVKNDSISSMPVGIAFHTCISMLFGRDSLSEKVFLRSDIGSEYGRDPDRLLTVWEPLKSDSVRQDIINGCFDLSKNPISRQYIQGHSRKITITDSASDASIIYETNNAFFSWLFWRPAGCDFFSPEPHSWLINAPNAKLMPEETGFKTLLSNEALLFETKLRYQAYFSKSK